MNFVKKLSTGQTSILDGQVLKRDPESLAKEWAEEFAQDTKVCDVPGLVKGSDFASKFLSLPEIAGGVGILGQNAESVGKWNWVR